MATNKRHETFQKVETTIDNKLFDYPKNEEEYKELLKPNKLIRLAVSGDVLVTEIEKEIIDEQDFQRLRRLKQLGSAYLVYPTAIHTRFEHSLGALSMVDKMIRNIRENRHNREEMGENKISYSEEVLARLLALLHDITHIPFGHTLEDEFCIFQRHDEDTSRVEHFVGRGSKIGDIIIKKLGPDIHKRLIKLMTFDKKKDDLLKGLEEDSVAYDLVSNTVCADLLDYLKRDHFYCNLPLGLEYRFLNFLYVYKHEGTKRVAVRLWKVGQTSARIDILNELVALLEYRYKLAEVVYFHHTKLISGSMLAGAVYREKSENKDFTIEKLYDMGDDELVLELKKSKNPVVRKLITNFENRKLWKEICKKTHLDIQKEDGNDSTVDYIESYRKDFYENAKQRCDNEKEIAEFLGMEDGDFLLNCPNPKMQLKYAEMKVFWKGKYRELSQCKGEEIDLIRKKLNLILLSHENLFTIRGYVNYEYMDKEKKSREDTKRDVTKAFNQLLSYNTQREHHDREWARVIMKKHIESNYDVSTISHALINELEVNAVNRYLSPADYTNPPDKDPKNRSKDFVSKIVNEEALKLRIIQTNEEN